jgi:rod shape determining protein RodA
MSVDRRALFNIDWVLLGAVGALLLLSIVTIRSATFESPRFAGLYVKQIYAIGLGLCAFFAMLMVDYRRFADRSLWIYIAVAASLVAVLLLAPRIAGTRRWFLIAGVGQFQPAEFAKIAAALLLAKIFSESRKDSLGLAEILFPGIAIALLTALIAAEPDLGTAFCLVPLFLSVTFMAGLRLKTILGLFVAMAVVVSIGWQFALPYQKERVYNFLDSSRDPQGAGWQKRQSQIAVGSGGLLGKGYQQGSQSQLGYLPARQTDFILSVLAEEFGFLGVMGVLALYLLVLWRALETAQLARDRLGAFLAAGLAATFGFQVVYNVAMIAGLVPVKGLPLPFMSYGGSSVLASLMGVGLILNVRMRRFAN